ncbi:hypothetical protein CMESO_458 (nucleomorph) [Chroomonas mesostigmatica CCMP1168]|uniref:Uncharacterized protein n=1 Tax=Chroomonas mesostigmatica CCMP1168 TaxID=1195612 RepID=J7G2B8_9CRYP|nr:hypothetical protein CMESO_458 [Chroomonas mesostigmatica CCMP1168]
MEKNELYFHLEKFLIEIISELNAKVSQKFIKKITDYCSVCLDIFSLETSNFCEKKCRNILNEKNFFFVLKKLGCELYISEINEEKNRCFFENLKFNETFV